MNRKCIQVALTFVIVLMFIVPPAWAKAEGYCFVISYSSNLKKVYCSPVFMVKVREVSYSDTEYVADVVLIQKIEAQFQNFLAGSANVDTSSFTIVTRGAFKKYNLAAQSLTAEKKLYTNKNYDEIDLTGFKFNR